MKQFLKYLLCIFTLTSIHYCVSAQNIDKQNATDHPAVPRLKNYFINNYQEHRFDFENFRTENGSVRVEGHKLEIDYRLSSQLAAKGKNFVFESYKKLLDSPQTNVMLDGPYYLVFKIDNDQKETWVKIDPLNTNGERYILTIVEKEKMKQEVAPNVARAEIHHANDAKGSKDYPILSRMSDFYIGGYEETEQASETFRTSNGKIDIDGNKIYIDYYLEDGKVPPGKIQILENYKTSLLNSGAEILLDGAYYDVYRIQNNRGEKWIKIDPGNYDGKRYAITVVETSKTTKLKGDKSKRIKLSELDVLQETGNPLQKKEINQLSTLKIFTYDSPQKVIFKTKVLNPSSLAINNLFVEFKCNGEVIKTTELVTLAPGTETQVACEKILPDISSYDVEVNVYEANTTQALASIDGLLKGTNDSSNITGYVYPDFEIRDIAYLTNPGRIAVEIQNNGAIYIQTPLHLKTWISNPYKNYSDTYEKTLNIELGPGERKWSNLISSFAWPNVRDNPVLNFTVKLEAQQEITETDKRNNSYFKQVCAPCDINIEHLSNNWVYKFSKDDLSNRIFQTIYLYGQFGYKRTSKYVLFKDKKSGILYTPELIQNKRDPLIWDDFCLEVNTSSLPVGEYQVLVNCTPPINNSFIPFASNAIDFRVKKKPDKPFNFGKWGRIAILEPTQVLREIIPEDETLDARKLANALAEEFTADLDLPIEENLTIWTEQSNSDIFLFSSTDESFNPFEKIIFEIWNIEPYYRKYYSEITTAPEQNSIQTKVRGLQSGLYEFKGRYIFLGGKEKSISIVFRVEIY